MGLHRDIEFVPSSSGVNVIHHLFSYPVLCGVVGAISIPLLRETYAPVIRQKKAVKSGDAERAVSNLPGLLEERGKLYYIWLNLSRPITLLFGSLICFLFSLYMAL